MTQPTDNPDTTNAAETTTASDAEQPADTSPQDDGGNDDAVVTANREAAKYRRRLRETETERDTLAARVEAMTRAEIERTTAARLTDPADLWRAGIQLADLIAGDGSIDTTKLDTAIAAVAEQHPHWAKQPPTPNPRRAGLRSGAAAPQGTAPSWSSLLNNR